MILKTYTKMWWEMVLVIWSGSTGSLLCKDDQMTHQAYCSGQESGSIIINVRVVWVTPTDNGLNMYGCSHLTPPHYLGWSSFGPICVWCVWNLKQYHRMTLAFFYILLRCPLLSTFPLFSDQSSALLHIM